MDCEWHSYLKKNVPRGTFFLIWRYTLQKNRFSNSKFLRHTNKQKIKISMTNISNMQNKKFDAEIGKVLHLMIHSLYTNKEIFLRELISNSSDACDKFRYESIQHPEIATDEKFKITIKIDKLKQTLTISDNGIGMNREEMIENLGKIASSGTQKFLEQIGKNQQDVTLIGQFGVGFYSVFMVANSVKVFSTKAGETTTYAWESDGKVGYSISTLEESQSRGTSIELHMQDSAVEFLEQYRIKHIVNTYSNHIDFPIELINEVQESEVINDSSAIWTRPKSEISEEQYLHFYQKIAHMPGEPMLTIHNKVEGNLEYTNLLFIPKQKPFDLFHPDRKAMVKLYVKKVFITDDGIELIPRYMRFLRGVVDSNDLPLNISRETLQHNPIISKIKKSIVKRVLSTLKQISKEKLELYNEFWSNFGEVMKEGLCESALEEKEDLLEACRFYSTKSEGYVSLDEYIERMPSEQNEIYYMTGHSIESMRQNPQLEGFIKRDIEVLLLTDHVDEFWVNVINQYKNKDLKSITNSAINLEDIQKLPSDNNLLDDTQEKALTDYIKKVLGDRIKEVRTSTKLIDSPACLAIPDGAMNIRMENLLMDQKQLNKRSAKILEINIKHHLFTDLIRHLSDDSIDDRDNNIVEVIFGQASLVAGEPLLNPSDFVKRLNKLIGI